MYCHHWEEAWGVRACRENTAVFSAEVRLVPKPGEGTTPTADQLRVQLSAWYQSQGFTDSRTAEW